MTRLKSPDDIINILHKDWQNKPKRIDRLLNHHYPITIKIGTPTANDLKNHLAMVREHFIIWHNFEKEILNHGNIALIWQNKKYQSLGNVDYPDYLQLNSYQDWLFLLKIRQTETAKQLSWVIDLLEHEYIKHHLSKHDDLTFHQLTLIITSDKYYDESVDTMVSIIILAKYLDKHIMAGYSLRSFDINTIINRCAESEKHYLYKSHFDSKFFERYTYLFEQLLELRFANEVKSVGLAHFLGVDNNAHWLLLSECCDEPLYLPFSQIYAPHHELDPDKIICDNILIVENKHSLKQLPTLKNTLMILGAGNNLSWLKNKSWQHKKLYYWGDIDTWGMAILAKAQTCQSHIVPILMDHDILNAHRHKIVPEPKSIENTPIGLNDTQLALFHHLKNNQIRLEQEFIELDYVRSTMIELGLHFRAC
ncbi:Wadjet anti-phage system protein JetD domain-containing protein [Moraxella lacunata]|uniref:Wadjet protein JetD C-terminal domain-containing protein n=1 Tax=Moraxella lacunata TaxID=477 RepID=A0A1V4GM27_MORLA|nr:Wadjet anti-phage system protein JetD domain-containing protein [Moraxella lacunata]OPH33692.1 hypothetical protein B5J94_12665 [Moraxella lacunata]